MSERYKPKGDNYIPPFFVFDKNVDAGFAPRFFNLPVYDIDEGNKPVDGTSYQFKDFCSGPFVNLYAAQQAEYCLAVDDFYITSNPNAQTGENEITFWDKGEIPEQIDYVGTNRPPRLSKPMIFKPLFSWTGLVPKRMEMDWHAKRLTCRPRTVTENQKRIVNDDDWTAFMLINRMNFDTVSSCTANRFFYPNSEIRQGANTEIIFKVGPLSYRMVILIRPDFGYVKQITYDKDKKEFEESFYADINRNVDLVNVLREIKRLRDAYVEKQYIH